MNERILELAKQAGLKKPHASDREYIGDFDWRKFAELIVEECMTLCKTSVGNADYNTGRLHCLNNIKEHFGVKE